MLRVVFLCSGGGGNLRFVAEAIRLGLLADAKLVGVITDRECPAGQFARQSNIPLWEHDFSEKGRLGLRQRLIELNPGVAVSNVHKILSPAIVEPFQGKLINLHYSLLPSFGGVIGTKALSQALDYGVKLVGATVHLVDNLVDSGAPLAQAVVPVMANDDVPTLMDVVFRIGCMSLLTGMQLIRQDQKIILKNPDYLREISGRSVLFNPPMVNMPKLQEESFWERLK